MDTVDPRAPRFGQAITAGFALGAVVLGTPWLVYALAVLLVVPVATRWRVDPYRFLYQRVVRRFISPPAETESALPHRFARVVGAFLTAPAAGVLLVAGVTGATPLAWVGYGLAALVGALALLGAATGFCLGCRMYRSVGRFRRLGLLESSQP